MTSADVVVLGGGPAGLAAAWWVARTGRAAVVVERSAHLGGMAASFDVAGLRVDHGSHRLHPATPAPVLAELRALLGDELQHRRRNGRIVLDGRFVRFPLSPLDAARRLPASFAVGVARDALTSPWRRQRADTFAEAVRAGLGPTMGERFYFPYARKLWGLEPDELAGEQARRRIRSSTPAALARRVVRRGGSGATFWYPSGGFGRIPEVLAAAAADAGAELRTGVAASSVRLAAGGVSVELATGDTIEAAQVWSTIPLPALAALAGAPEPVVRAGASLTHRAMVLLYLVVPVSRWTPFDAHYLPGPQTAVTRLSEPKNYRDGNDPPARTVLCAEIPCAPGDAVWSAGADELAATVVDELARVGLPPVDVAGVALRRLPAAYPVYRVGFDRHLPVLDAWVAAQPRLRSFGRLGLFAHDNTHHALAEAWEATRTVDDPAAWARARGGFAAHVVED